MERTGRTVAKRPHKKSKNGCRTCRTRRVKCDEVHPLCGPCRKHCICCYYDRPDPNVRSRQLTRSPSTSSVSTVELVPSERIDLRDSTPPSSSAAAAAAWMRPPPWFGCPDKRVLDLQLMNFYTYVSTTGRPETSARMRYVWAYEVPQKALGCDYLMYSLLSYAALYIHIRNPYDIEICEVSHSYFGKAVRCLSHMVALVDDTNAEYVFAASQLIYVQASLQWLDPCNRDEPYQLPLQWLTMGHGVGSIMRDRVPAISRTSMNVMLQKPPARDPVRNGEYIIDNVKRMITYDETPDVFSMKKVLMYLKCLYDAVQNETIAYGRQRMLLFPIILDGEYFKMLRARDPRALIAMVFYFAAMKNLEGHWWYDGRAKHEITGIAAMLPEQYKYNIAWPLETIEGRNTGIPDWEAIQSCIPIELGDLDSKMWYR